VELEQPLIHHLVEVELEDIFYIQRIRLDKVHKVIQLLLEVVEQVEFWYQGLQLDLKEFKEKIQHLVLVQ
jgi:hypothetical protein